MNQTSFELHPRLRADTHCLGDFPLCRLLLMNDRRYPWFILVPRRSGIREIFALPQRDQVQLLKESSHLATVLQHLYRADKLNIASLGNLVPQLHLHHIVRFTTDPAWPRPVWGLFPAEPYAVKDGQDIFAKLSGYLVDFKPAANPFETSATC